MAEQAEILPIMIGTAGHVDHGKTSLVRNLTGIDTDRMQEEKQRGLSIDFGVAPLMLRGNRTVGIIDVPGHEDFIRNMTAGASSIDILMLVVAADDSIMPQTVEHLRIVKLLGMSRLLAVITKADLSDLETLEFVREDVGEFLTRAGYPAAPIHVVSNVSGAGMDGLRDILEQMVAESEAELRRKMPDTRAFRMDVRSVFSMKGHGTVITGVPSAGRLSVGDPLILEPGGIPTAVRGIQNYRRTTGQTEAHMSSAINIRDGDPAQIGRGMSLVAPGSYSLSATAIAAFDNDSEDFVMPKRGTFRFHCGTGAAAVSCRLIAAETAEPGEQRFLHLRFPAPRIVAAGDRFILRAESSGKTLGGGIILAVQTGRMRRYTADSLPRFETAHAAARAGDFFGSQLIAGSQMVFRGSELLRLTQCVSTAAAERVTDKKENGELIDLGGDCWAVRCRLDDLRFAVSRALHSYHQLNRSSWGMKPSHALSLLHIESATAEHLTRILQDGNSEICLKHGRLALQSFQPNISAKEIALREAMLQAVSEAGIVSVARGILLQTLGISGPELRTITRLLVDEDRIVVLGNNFLLGELYERCRERLLELFTGTTTVELNAFREATGTSRNIATLILDSFDAQGLTKRTDAGRVLNRRLKTTHKAERPHSGD
jgi:selenocysteine-specific elongation factor